MFHSGMVESRDGAVIVIEDVHYPIFTLMLEFLYTDSCTIADLQPGTAVVSRIVISFTYHKLVLYLHDLFRACYPVRALYLVLSRSTLS